MQNTVLNDSPYITLPSEAVVAKTMKSLEERGITSSLYPNREAALEALKKMIPEGASIVNGSSRTLEEIGFIEFLKSGSHPWNNLQEKIVEESDREKQTLLRKKSVADYFTGSVHAVAETGELIIASGSGSQLPPLVFTASNVLLVVGVQKITPDLSSGIARLKEYVYPLEDERMKSVGMGGSVLSKLLIINSEPAFMGRTFHVLFVNEKLGF
ncbi:MAG TPA: lactate utilization protein [Candidatus Gracilibacteria bacterium]|nr:lactate utilization protein [Candidatus Gracilibacteria bacterium]